MSTEPVAHSVPEDPIDPRVRSDGSCSAEASDEYLIRELQAIRRSETGRSHFGHQTCVGGYQIVREIRRGGQGVVYEAVQLATGRPIALKVLLHAGFQSPAARTRFQREAELLALLRHPSIVTLHDFGDVDGELFYVMEYVDGTPLNKVREFQLPDRIHQRTAQLHLVLKTMAVISDAVACFQRRGLIHRDLKPDNILIDRDGVPRIVDFGLARLSSDTSEGTSWHRGQTMEGEFLGTPAYASPEQIQGSPDAIDIRTDVYSLGVILYELLTGRPPIPMSNSLIESLRAVTEHEPIRPSVINPAIDRDTESIILKCLSKSVDRRYQTASDLALDLNRRLDGQPILARSDSAAYLLRSSLRRHRIAARIAAIIFVIIVTSSLVIFQLWRQAVYERTEARAATYRSSLLAAIAAVREDRTQDAADLLMQAPLEFRGWEWSYVISRIDDSIASRRLSDEAVLMAQWTNDSQEIAIVLTTGGLRIARELDFRTRNGGNPSMPLSTGIEPPEIQSDGVLKASHVAIVEGSNLLAVIFQDNQLRWFDRDARQWLAIHTEIPGTVAAVCPCPSENSVFVASVKGHNKTEIYRVAADDQSVTALAVIPWIAHCMAITPPAANSQSGSEQLFVAGMELAAFDIEQSGLTAAFASRRLTTDINCIAVSPDRSLVACGQTDGTLSGIATQTGELQLEIRSHGGPVSAVAFSDDSKLLVTGCQDSLTRVWSAESGALVQSLRGHLHWIQAVRFVDETRVDSISARGELKRFRFDVDSGDVIFKAHDSIVTGLHFNTASDGVYSGSLDGSVRYQPVGAAAIGRSLTAGHVSVTAMSRGYGLWNSIAGREDGTIIGLQEDGAEHYQFLPIPGDAIRSVAQSGLTENLVAGFESGEVLLIDIDSPGNVRSITRHLKPVRYVAFAQNDTVLISEDETVLRATRLESGELLQEFPRSMSLYYAPFAVSPDGRLLVAGDSSGRLRTWEILTGQEQPPFEWHATSVTAVNFSPDGTRLVSAAADGAVKIWNVERRQEVFSLPDVKGFAVQLCFSPDGRRIAVGLYDGSIILFEGLIAARRSSIVSGPSLTTDTEPER
ncbi:MAG: protein kinase [Planctomyces sp.]|nr:protein kinase [Planctomyces sp.]